MILEQWHCDDCEKDFYLTEEEDHGNIWCPYCGTHSGAVRFVELWWEEYKYP